MLLLIAARLAPADVGVLRTLAYAFLIDGSPHRAMAVIDRERYGQPACTGLLHVGVRLAREFQLPGGGKFCCDLGRLQPTTTAARFQPSHRGRSSRLNV